MVLCHLYPRVEQWALVKAFCLPILAYGILQRRSIETISTTYDRIRRPSYLVPPRSIFPDLDQFLVEFLSLLINVVSIEFCGVDRDIRFNRHNGVALIRTEDAL
jgi:hypothetical protein